MAKTNVILCSLNHLPKVDRVYAMTQGNPQGFVAVHNLSEMARFGQPQNLKFLAPTREMVYGHKRSQGRTESYYQKYEAITDKQYTDMYRALLKSRWQTVKSWLDSLKTDETIALCCYCGEGQFCHRQLIAQMLKKWRPDLVVELR